MTVSSLTQPLSYYVRGTLAVKVHIQGTGIVFQYDAVNCTGYGLLKALVVRTVYVHL